MCRLQIRSISLNKDRTIERVILVGDVETIRVSVGQQIPARIVVVELLKASIRVAQIDHLPPSVVFARRDIAAAINLSSHVAAHIIILSLHRSVRVVDGNNAI